MRRLVTSVFMTKCNFENAMTYIVRTNARIADATGVSVNTSCSRSRRNWDMNFTVDFIHTFVSYKASTTYEEYCGWW